MPKVIGMPSNYITSHSHQILSITFILRMLKWNNNLSQISHIVLFKETPQLQLPQSLKNSFHGRENRGTLQYSLLFFPICGNRTRSDRQKAGRKKKLKKKGVTTKWGEGIHWTRNRDSGFVEVSSGKQSSSHDKREDVDDILDITFASFRISPSEH